MRVFGDPLSAWRNHMPSQMFLKSHASASSLSAPEPGYALSDFCAETGAPPVRDDEPVPIERFVQYGLWFQERLVPNTERVEVHDVRRNGNGFELRLESDEVVRTPAVVLASGHLSFAHVPTELGAIAPEGPSARGAVSHSSQHTDFSRFAGRDVAVIGAGQSALETAALLYEAGAAPQLLVRRPRVLWAHAPKGKPGRRHMPAPDSPLGRSWSLYAVSRWPDVLSELPRRSRLLLVRKILGPAGAWWLRQRVVGLVEVRTGWRLEQASLVDGRIRLRGRTESGARDALTVDHVIASTGYRVDVDSISFLERGLRRQLRSVVGWPVLTRASESSIPGLFFTGLPAAATFGPLLRFVAGTAFAAPRISAALAARARA